MTRTPRPARTTARRTRWLLLACLLGVTAVFTAALGHSDATTPASAAPAASGALAHTVPSASLARAAPSTAPRSPARPSKHHKTLGEADGVVPDGVTVFDDETPAVANLDPALLKALRRAAKDAADDGVDLTVNSGWRSAAYQEQLLDEAVSKYGSRRKAARWVATPTTSAHVSGHAVDIGPSAAAAWLSGHGAAYGLCRTYRNEPWHYELHPTAVTSGCPRPYADPTQDPRMQP